MMPPKPSVYQLRVDGQFKAIRTPDLAEAHALAEPLLSQGRRVEIVDITTGKVTDA